MVDLWIMSPAAARRDWLSSVVAGDPQLRIVGTATTFAYLRSLMSEDSADVSLIELQNAHRDWLTELLELTPIVLLAPEPNSVMSNWIRRSEVGAMLHSDAAPDQILAAIHSVSAGLSTFDPALTPEIPDDEPRLESLTPRESEVLRLLADGLGNREIAKSLSISEHTIKFHVHSILSKLGAASRTEAVTRGLRSGLIEL